MTSVKSKFKFVLDSGDANTDKIKFGNQKGLRDVATIDGKHFSYNPKEYKTINKQINKTIKTQQKYKLATDIRQIYLKHR